MSFFKNLPLLQNGLKGWRQGNWPARLWKLAFFVLLLVYLGQHEWHFSIELISNPAKGLQPYSLLEDRQSAQPAGWVEGSTDNVSTDGKTPLGSEQQKYLAYIEQYAPTAVAEREQFGIPASITLAQAILESDAGESPLAKKEHNHFGIKCRKKCKGCRCANYSDDSHYDMFRIFQSDWHSFREHSKLLQSSRYKHLLKLDAKDYRNWAYGLKAAGYATDPKYPEKLIQLIEDFDLSRFD